MWLLLLTSRGNVRVSALFHLLSRYNLSHNHRFGFHRPEPGCCSSPPSSTAIQRGRAAECASLTPRLPSISWSPVLLPFCSPLPGCVSSNTLALRRCCWAAASPSAKLRVLHGLRARGWLFLKPPGSSPLELLWQLGKSSATWCSTSLGSTGFNIDQNAILLWFILGSSWLPPLRFFANEAQCK